MEVSTVRNNARTTDFYTRGWPCPDQQRVQWPASTLVHCPVTNAPCFCWGTTWCTLRSETSVWRSIRKTTRSTRRVSRRKKKKVNKCACARGEASDGASPAPVDSKRRLLIQFTASRGEGREECWGQRQRGECSQRRVGRWPIGGWSEICQQWQSRRRKEKSKVHPQYEKDLWENKQTQHAHRPTSQKIFKPHHPMH